MPFSFYQHRPDLVLSNWVFAWFLLYFFGWVRHSPLLVLLIGIAANTYEYLSTQQGQSDAWKRHYVVRNLLIKVAPVALLLRSKNNRVRWGKDLTAMAVFYGLFLVWVGVNGAFMGAYKPTNPFNFNPKTP